MRALRLTVAATTVLAMWCPSVSPGAATPVTTAGARGASRAVVSPVHAGAGASQARPSAPGTAGPTALPVDPRFRLRGLSIDHGVIDVTRSSRRVTLTIRASHPAGLVEGEIVVRLQTSPGSHAGGWEPGVSPRRVWASGHRSRFTATFEIPRYAEPTLLDAEVDYTPVTNRQTSVVRHGVLRILDRTPDTLPPRIVSLHVGAQGGLPVDVRHRSRRVRVAVHIVDDRSGPDLVRSNVVLRAVDPGNAVDQDVYYVPVRLVSGTPRDGVWAGSIRMAPHESGGDWDTTVVLFDRVHDVGESYSGALLRDYAALPAGSGPFTVRGRGDRWRPTVVSVSVSPATVIPTSDPVVVTVEARVLDRGRGVLAVVADLEGDLSTPGPVTLTRPSRGTRHDGVWKFSIRLEAGATNVLGSLWLHLRVADTNHVRWYSARTAARVGDWRGDTTLSPAQLGGGTGRLLVA